MLIKPTIICDQCKAQLDVLDTPRPQSAWPDDRGWYELRKPGVGENYREAHFCDKKCLSEWLEGSAWF